MTESAFSAGPNVFVHELGHYWGVGWGTQGQAQCFDPWASSVYNFTTGHWSNNLEAGQKSTLSYGNLMRAKTGEELYPNWGRITDNKDGTFTSSITTRINDARFNNIDLYAMGLMTKEELATKDMFAVYDLQQKAPLSDTYYGTRKTVTLDDLKTILKEKTACSIKNSYMPGYSQGYDTYYTGDGNRVLDSYDQGKELAKDFKVGLVLIKHPEQVISNKMARDICQAANYDYPKAWSDATYGLSTIHTELSDATKNPNCASLFPPSSD
jgi:hypothetical protein